jgi:hypothetical protein
MPRGTYRSLRALSRPCKPAPQMKARSAHPQRYARQCAGTQRANDPRDRSVRKAYAAVTPGRAERIDQARSAAAVDAHPPIAAAELLEHVAVSGDRQDVRAEEVRRVPRPDADDREEPVRRGGGWSPDHHPEPAHPVTTAVDRDRPGAARDDDAPARDAQLSAIGVDPRRRIVRPGGQSHSQPAASPVIARGAQHEQPRSLAGREPPGAPVAAPRHRAPNPGPHDRSGSPGERGRGPADTIGARSARAAVRRSRVRRRRSDTEQGHAHPGDCGCCCDRIRAREAHAARIVPEAPPPSEWPER